MKTLECSGTEGG